MPRENRTWKRVLSDRRPFAHALPSGFPHAGLSRVEDPGRAAGRHSPARRRRKGGAGGCSARAARVSRRYRLVRARTGDVIMAQDARAGTVATGRGWRRGSNSNSPRGGEGGDALRRGQRTNCSPLSRAEIHAASSSTSGGRTFPFDRLVVGCLCRRVHARDAGGVGQQEMLADESGRWQLCQDV